MRAAATASGAGRSVAIAYLGLESLQPVDDPQQVEPDRHVHIDEPLPAVCLGLGDQLIGSVELLLVRAKSFKTKSDAGVWSKGYIKADRQGRLREFLLGPGAAAPKGDATPVAELILDWLATDAHPDSPGGLARSTWDSYRSVASRHVIGNPVERELKKTGEIVEVEPAIKPLGQQGGYAIGRIPAVQFETADVLKRWVQAMRKAGASATTEARAWKVLSSALSWAVEDDNWPLSTNGCLTMQRRRGMRRASRRAGTGAAREPASGKRRDDLASWALSPLAVERIRLAMLERLDQRSPLLALRDATVVSVQYGLGMRNQEVWALTLGDVAGRRASVREVLSYGLWTPARQRAPLARHADHRSTPSWLTTSSPGRPPCRLTAIRPPVTTSYCAATSAATVHPTAT